MDRLCCSRRFRSGGDGGEDNSEGNIDITSIFEDRGQGNTDGGQGNTDGGTRYQAYMDSGALAEGDSGALAGAIGISGALADGDHNSDTTTNEDKTSMESSQSSSARYASATEEESIPVPSQQPQFTHITKLIAEDLKKMPMEEIRTYPWSELDDKDVELVIKYLSYEPKFLGKILVNTPEDGISKFQNSISLKTFNQIIANMPPEQVQLIKDKLS